MTGVDVLYDIASAQTEEQGRRRQHLNTMASGLLAFAGAMVAVTIVLAKDAGGDPEALVVSIVVAFLLTAGCVFGVLRPRRWARQPPLPLMLQHVVNAEFEDDELIAWAARQMTTAITNNEVLLGQKSGWLLNAYVECRRSSHIVGSADCVWRMISYFCDFARLSDRSRFGKVSRI